MQDKTLYADVSSPTVSMTALYIICALAAHKDMHVCTGDISGAYLKASMSQDDPVYVLLDPTVAAITAALDPSYSKYMDHKGQIVVLLKRALYGCVQSGKLWYDKISKDLMQMSFKKHPLDPCVFHNITGNNNIILLLYVDDIMIISTSTTQIANTRLKLQELYGFIKFNNGKSHNFLGQLFDFNTPGKCKVSMTNYVDELIKEFNVTELSATPAIGSLFLTDVNVTDSATAKIPNVQYLTHIEKSKFHTITAKLLYLSKRTRPDILLVVNFLTTRVLNPNIDDWNKLTRVLKYLKSTNSIGITLEPDHDLTVKASIDASYGVHQDRKSHSGTVICIGKGPIYCRSTKQRSVSKSSTEAELLALSDGASQVIWINNFLRYLHYKTGPAIIQQDNKSTIALIKNGTSSSERSRHIEIKHFWVNEQWLKNRIDIVYTPTEEMIADILTKPLQGEPFKSACRRLLNW
jgi:hypothetical protein